MNRLYGTRNGGHQGGNGNIHRLSRLQIPGIGIAVILLQAHMRIIGQGGNLLILGNRVAGIQRRHFHQFSGIPGRQIQAGNVLAQSVELLLIALYILARFFHSRTGCLRINGKQRRSGSNLLTLADQHLLYGTGRGQGNGLTLFRLCQTAAFHGGGNGPVLDDIRHHSGCLFSLSSKHFEQPNGNCHQYHKRNNPANGLAPLFSGHGVPFLAQRALFGNLLLENRSGFRLLHGQVLFFHDFRHDRFSSSLLIRHELY